MELDFKRGAVLDNLAAFLQGVLVATSFGFCIHSNNCGIQNSKHGKDKWDSIKHNNSLYLVETAQGIKHSLSAFLDCGPSCELLSFCEDNWKRNTL